MNIYDTFTLRINYACNNECIHCFIGEKKEKNMDIDDIKKTIDSIKEKNIIITGGEPTLSLNFLEILKYIKNKNKKCFLQSNGRLFNDNEFANQTLEYIDTILVPIHSHNEKIFDIISGVNGAFKETIDGIENIKKTKVSIVSQTVINKLNYKDLLKTFNFINSLEIHKMMLTFPDAIGNANSKDIVPTYTESWQYIQEVVSKYHSKISTHYIPPCILYPYQDKIILVDKNEVNNSDNPGIEYINNEWRNVNYNKQLSSKIKSEKCKECIFDKECPGVWKEYYELYGFLDINPIKGDN